MSEPKTRCPACGAFILQRTADKYGGICGKCHHKAALIPPYDFQISPDLAQRLLAIEEDPMDYREMEWKYGPECKRGIQCEPEFMHEFIDKLEERYDLYCEWSPRLREFSQECRDANPQPLDSTLSRRDRAIQEICKAKVANGYLPSRRNAVTICCLPLIAIPVAQRLRPGEDIIMRSY